MRVAALLLLAVGLGYSQSAAGAEDLAVGLRKCSAVADSLQRLVCYDNLAKRTATGAATSATAGTTATAPQPLVSSSSSSTSKPKAATSVRCQATTKKGAQCKRNAAAGSSYCWQHGG